MALTDGCVAYYKLDGDATDATGNGNDGTVYGASWTDGKINQCADFDGSNDYISFTPSFSVNQLSLSAWLKYTDSSTAMMPFRFSGSKSSYDAAFQLYLNNNDDLQVLSFGEGSNLGGTISNSNLYNGNWHHILVVMDYVDNTIRIWIDDEEQLISYTHQDLSYSSLDFDIESYIGGEAHEDRRYYNGIIDEVGVWNRALSSSEVEELYNNGNGLQYPFPTSINWKVWNGSEWGEHPVKYYDGSDWVEAKSIKRWNGSEWVEL